MSHEKTENTKSEGEEQAKEEIKQEISDQPEEEVKEETKTIEASIDEVPSSYKRIGELKRHQERSCKEQDQKEDKTHIRYFHYHLGNSDFVMSF